ncbi:MAG: HPr(Ser) kinase/phosphatase [Myxococcales bacterium]|jgi:HPr kinase/phosphorylase
MKTITVAALLGPNPYDLRLVLLAGKEGLDHPISSTRVQKPGLALAGFYEHLHPERVQVFGNTEMSYLATLAPRRQREVIIDFFKSNIACLVITKNLDVPPFMIDEANAAGVPLLKTPLLSRVFIQRVQQMLDAGLTPRTSLHGVLLDVFGVGILILGKSGIGKSECALDLVMRGHRLAADDIVEVWRSGDTVYGSGSPIIKHHMEIRGLGIINIKDLFGVAAVRDTKKIQLVIELVEWHPEEEYDRLGIEERSFNVLDVPVPLLVVPVRPGRNVTTIIEVAARNHLLKLQGHHSARAFQDQLSRAIAEGTGAQVPREEPE